MKQKATTAAMLSHLLQVTKTQYLSFIQQGFYQT